jgi:opacity protein-like surface antigen
MSPIALSAQEGNRLRLTASADYSYVAPGDTKFQGTSGRKSDAQSVNAGIGGSVPLSDRWFLPVGIGSGNFFLGSVPGTPIPDRIDTLRLSAGLGYRFNDQWSISAALGPVFYRLDEIGTDDLGIAGGVNALYRVSPKLTWSFGIGFSPESDIPVLPAAGVRWNIQTNLTLNLMFPRPVLIYRVAPKVGLFAGGDFKFAVFRADKNTGDTIGQPAFNNALGTYHDFHLGAGVEYELIHGLFLSFEGGYSLGRELDYKRLDQTVTFDPTPYCQAGVRCRF